MHAAGIHGVITGQAEKGSCSLHRPKISDVFFVRAHSSRQHKLKTRGRVVIIDTSTVMYRDADSYSYRYLLESAMIPILDI